MEESKPMIKDEPETPETGAEFDKRWAAEGHMSKVKEELNKIIWTYAPHQMTLGQADALAGNMLGMANDAFQSLVK